MRAAGVMQWTVRLEARTSAGEVKTTELVTFSRPGVVSTLAEIGLVLSETKALLAKLQASMLCGQVAEYAAHHRACAACGVLQPVGVRNSPKNKPAGPVGLYGVLRIGPCCRGRPCRFCAPQARG